MNDYDYGGQNGEEDPKKLRLILQTRAAELFKLCDVEDKGFINKKDIQRMQEPLGLTPDLLEEVFDSLDIDKNGFLTLEEFTAGFSSYLGGQIDEPADAQNTSLVTEEELEDETLFRETMDSLGASNLVDGDQNIKDIWIRLRHENPSMQKSFEDFIANVSQEIKKSRTDFNQLENALHSKSSTYDESVKKLYEEMESQIKAEKSRIMAQEKIKEREMKEKLEQDLKDKERLLQDSLGKQVEMEQKLFKLNLLEYQQKQENDRLLKEKAALEEQLQERTKNLQDSKTYISTLVEQTKQEKRNRAKQSLKVTEKIALERENLVKELNMLKEINKKLQDERDELQLQTAEPTEKLPERPRHKLTKQGSILSNYLRPSTLNIEMAEIPFNPIQMVSADDYSEDESYSSEAVEPTRRHVTMMKREQLVGANQIAQHNDILNVPPNATPQRVFKIVLIGDSGVGKTSFVQRFCNNSFRESFSTTIGVDFQVKSIMIDNRVIALQLWDTAGQERYRSITKQYFRKADGVICMYDITSEQSFKNLRNWITSMRESASEECVLAIIGNKIDLCENDDTRVVKYKDGAGLAEEQSALFYETSSKESKYVVETMEAIARILQEKEDKQIEDVLNLRVKQKKKSGCCS